MVRDKFLWSRTPQVFLAAENPLLEPADTGECVYMLAHKMK